MSRYDYTGPEKFRPLSPWAYFGYSILFSIPLVGFIALIVLSFNSSNVNRRSFARSFWCAYIIAAVLAIAAYALGGLGLLYSAFTQTL